MMVTGVQNRTTSRETAQKFRRRHSDIVNSDRALVPVTLAAAVEHDAPVAPASARPSTFLAHLVAMRDQAPQTRMRNRATPADAISAYKTTMAMSADEAQPTARKL